MRLRNIQGSRTMVDNSQYILHEPEKYKDVWKNFFKRDQPLHIEIGMGKGTFLQTMASKYPEFASVTYVINSLT